MKRHPPMAAAALTLAANLGQSVRLLPCVLVHSVRRLNSRGRFDASIDLLMTFKGQSVTSFTIQINLLIMELSPAEALSKSHESSLGMRNMRFVYDRPTEHV